MNDLNQFLWVIFPYVMLTIFVVGHIYRYLTDQMGWTSESSEFLEKKSLRWGSLLFHYGILLVFGGHVVGLLVPKSILATVGVSDEAYHLVAVYFGGAAGVVTVIGLFLLLVRRYGDTRVSVTSNFGDKFIALLLFLVIGFGIYNTLGFNLFVGGFDYRTTISPWLRGLIVFSPNPNLMLGVPLVYRLHVIFAFLVFGVWPFTRLVHVWSVPIAYLTRSPIIYRKPCGQTP
ncbi:MAG: respiratory nitrate reductase subunit gamma [Calditrichaeota bacterium]|nr:respiratory nitrate reductase subunit gamma [Calditrichota bacterium]